MIRLPYEASAAYLFFDGSSCDAWVQGLSLAGMPALEPGESRTERIAVLSQEGNLGEAAARLFDLLHRLDKLGASVIRAQRVPGYGLGAAINDRLSRAAAGS
jgi:hypothetical protein